MTEPAATAAAPPPRRPVLLLVEDHLDTRQMYAEFLGGSFEVITASDGAQALDLLRQTTPDVLVTDLSLPRVDGFELVGRIRARPELSTLPIVCLSGYGGHQHEQRALEAGCDRILQKPCMPDALAGVVLDLLRRRRVSGA